VNPKLNSFRALIIDDYPDIVELLAFIVEANFAAETVTALSCKSAKEILDKDSRFDLIVSDMNMPDGSGKDIFDFAKSKSMNIPIVFVTADSLDHYPDLAKSPIVFHVSKPFSDDQIVGAVEKAMSKEHKVSQQFIPVHLGLLRKVKEIQVPLFIKINEDKYVKLTQEESVFAAEDEAKYMGRGLSHLYIESIFSEQFILNYRKEILAKEAWDRLSMSEFSDSIKINVELLRNISLEMGWSENLVHLAQDNLQKSLVLARNHPRLTTIVNEFQKKDKFGYADTCAMMMLVTSGLAHETDRADELTILKLTLASLVHDMALTEQEYKIKEKLIQQIRNKEPINTKELKNIVTHPAQAAELAKNWKFCPPDVDIIIANHHESPDGSGFPLGRDHTQIDELSALFIVAVEFVNFYIVNQGKPDSEQIDKFFSGKYLEKPFLQYSTIIKEYVKSKAG
jgi:response regulator RpfG family c-di-GMP phosphodiesterase